MLDDPSSHSRPRGALAGQYQTTAARVLRSEDLQKARQCTSHIGLEDGSHVKVVFLTKKWPSIMKNKRI